MLYWFARAVIRLVAAVILRWRVEGRKNVPATGPVLLAINHTSAVDPFLGGSAIDRRVHFMAKEELFRLPLVGSLLRQLGAFPVRRGESDRRAIRQALALLEAGEVVGIFPEGTRSRDGRLQQAQTGIAFLAKRGRAAVVPMAITRGRSLRILIGEPLYAPSGGESAHEQYRRFADEVMQRINELMIRAS
ncbi:MAG: lysophospholipid acyltransferase family protein [Bacillota bacterium]|nr:lysophospholipid acyltransferase family protein [Bacillota bacterium]